MKRFVFCVVIFLLPLVVLSLAAVGVEWSCFRKAVRCPDAWIGVIGDSHPTCAINPKGHFPGLANFAQVTSQPMVWRAKLSVILEENPKLEAFLIEVWPGCYYRQTADNAQGRARYVRGFIPETAVLDVMRTNEMGGITRYRSDAKFHQRNHIPLYHALYDRLFWISLDARLFCA